MFLAHGSVSAQESSAIAWGTACSQPSSTHEVHGEVVNGKLYIFGGYDINKQPKWTSTKKAFVYDPVSNAWSAIADLPHTPNGPGFGGVTHVGLTNDGTNIYFAGGYVSNADGTGQIFGTKQVWRYNVATNTYTKLPDLPEALATGQLRYLNGKIHYMGGANLSRADVAVHYALDLNNLAAGWKSLAPLLNGCNHPGSAVYGGKIYFIGGAHHQDDNSITQKTIEAYDETTNTWTKLADMPTARDHISSAVIVVGDRILVLGGETSHNVKSNLVSAYSPATNTWTELTPLPVTKSAGVAAFLKGYVYYTGGNFSKTNYKGLPGSKNMTLSPLADAFVRDGSYAAKNYGKDTALLVKGATVSGYKRSSYLKFSLSNIGSLSSAKLRFYGHNTDNTNTVSLSAYGVSNDSWTESGITFNNAPAASTSALGAVNVGSSTKYYEIDVTNFVKTQCAGDKIVSFLLRDASNQNTNLAFNSKEKGTNKPQLLIVTPAKRSNNNELVETSSAENILESQNNSAKPFIYPNPSDKRFNIRFPSNYQGNCAISISDLSGRIFNIGNVTIPTGGSTINIDISRFNLHPGIYFLKINSGTKVEEMKLVVQ
jgi:N-acetylneuraminic acid mutarotase